MPDDAPATLNSFALDDLAPFKATHGFLPGASQQVRYFHAGRDDIHGLVKFLLSRTQHSLALSMYGYDDDDLNDMVLGLMQNPAIVVTITLDKSQAGGAHERKLLDLDRQKLVAEFNTHFAIGQSEFGHQILHTKGFVIDGILGCEGSVNWSSAGEGTFVSNREVAGGSGFKAQANTLSVFTCPAAIGEFAAVLAHQHQVAVQQMAKSHP